MPAGVPRAQHGRCNHEGGNPPMNPVTALRTTELAEAGLEGLQARLGDEKIVLPADVSWDEARQAWNLAVDQRPAAVALPETADEVIAVVRFALAGSAPDVGVVGYTLGGGLSWLGRRYGLGANSVTAIELVTPDGLFVRAT